MCSGRLGDRYTGLSAQALALKKQLSSFLFLVVFQQKNVEVVINDSIMQLISS